MPLYEYRCPDGHTTTAFRRTWREREEPEPCAQCGQTAPVIFSAPRVQNLSASENSLTSWGRNMRANGTKTLRQKIAETDTARRAGPNKAAEAAI